MQQLIWLLFKRKERQSKCGVQNSYLENTGKLMADFLACNNSNFYKNFLRPDEDLFQQILGRVRHRIEKNTQVREAISPGLRLAIYNHL